MTYDLDEGTPQHFRTESLTAITAVCRVCGRPLERGVRGRPREAHDACGEFVKFLRAAHARIHMIDFEEGRAGMFRRELFLMANDLPVEANRDELGRFTCR